VPNKSRVEGSGMGALPQPFSQASKVYDPRSPLKRISGLSILKLGGVVVEGAAYASVKEKLSKPPTPSPIDKP